MRFNFAALSDSILDRQSKIKAIETAAAEKTKALKAEVDELEQQLLLAMQDAGLKTFKGAKSVADVKESLRISIADYEALEKYAKRNTEKALALFERRISSKAYTELKESLGNKAIPGLSEFLQSKVTVKASK